MGACADSNITTNVIIVIIINIITVVMLVAIIIVRCRANLFVRSTEHFVHSSKSGFHSPDSSGVSP